MFTNTLRLFMLAWPFLKSVLLNDRTARDVFRSNLHFTIMFLITVMMTLLLLATVGTLGELKDELNTTQRSLLECQATASKDCVVPSQSSRYDKEYLLDLLEDLD